MKEALNERQMMAAIFKVADDIYVSTASTIGYDGGMPKVAEQAQNIKRLINMLERVYDYPESRIVA